MPPVQFYINQRCISETEPQLGLGIVTSVDRRCVTIRFPAQKTSRTYVVASAPLKRIVFGIGDTVLDSRNVKAEITGIIEDPLLHIVTYQCNGRQIPESAIADTSVAAAPLDRFKKGIIDPLEEFDTRYDLLRLHADTESSAIAGYIGCRIDLLPHQLSIADSVCRQRVPRALLADETGLGKTIEAGLILSRLHALGRITRALILVPESLVHQWFVELLRRFNLTARIITAESMEESGQKTDPFLEDQLFVADINMLADSATSAQISGAPWDLVIVDEAHHVRHGTPSFAVLEILTKKSCGMILLSATPEQLGREDHFFRLQLLDPQRYPDFAAYEKESLRLREISRIIDECYKQNSNTHTAADFTELSITVPPDTFVNQPAPMTCTVAELVDRFGTGRILFRNTRRNVTGFPQRIVERAPLTGTQEVLDALVHEMAADQKADLAATVCAGDPRIDWLAQLLKTHPLEKFLVIGTTRVKAEAIKELLQKKIKVELALFHESMTILQRDRNAAWFARPDGARVLICSESGSEGRNFQFCQHLVLFDLPLDPELLEQRIGRLDRIGQKRDIIIHVPFVTGSPQEILCRWYHEALNVFAANAPAAGRVYGDVRADLVLLLGSNTGANWAATVTTFIQHSKSLCDTYSKAITDSRDRLLELTSCQSWISRALIDEIVHAEREKTAEQIMDRLLAQYGIIAEEAAAHTQALNTECVTDHAFPLPRAERPVITFDRATALVREDVEFLTIDHPMVKDGLELALASGRGTATAAGFEQPGGPHLQLELIFILECLAPASFDTRRFLPALPIKVMIDDTGKDSTEGLKKSFSGKKYKPILPGRRFDFEVKQMLDVAATVAAHRMQSIVDSAIQKVNAYYDKEIERCRLLKVKGYSDDSVEQDVLEKEKAELVLLVNKTRARLDSLRLIVNSAGGVVEEPEEDVYESDVF